SAGSLNTVAREAGVAKGSLFQYFDGKLDFFSFVAEQTSDRVLDAMRPWLAGPPPGRAFADFLTDAVCAWVDYFDTHPLERGVTAATNLEIDSAVRAAVREPVHRIYVAGVRPLLEAARDRGELPPGTDVDAVLALLILMLAHLALAPFLPGLDPVLG
nr:TetR/AcrR family transcriptional regulator [Micromonospora sp. DSM 115978]